MSDPLKVKCPRCEQPPNHGCTTRSPKMRCFGCKPHAARVRAAEREEKEENRG